MLDKIGDLLGGNPMELMEKLQADEKVMALFGKIGNKEEAVDKIGLDNLMELAKMYSEDKDSAIDKLAELVKNLL